MAGKIGFIGLGIMGKPMAKNLMKHGHELCVYNRTQAKAKELVEEGAVLCETPAQVAARCDIIFLIVSDAPDVKAVLEGENGILNALRPGAVVVDMSSINPNASREFYQTVKAHGGSYMDAPVSGGEQGAIDGKLTIMVGGDDADFDRVKDLLLCMGRVAVHVGGIGSGNVTKCANQIITASNLAAVGEALTFAAKAGVDPRKVYDAIKGGMAQSAMFDSKFEKIIGRDFKPGFKLDLNIKDLKNVLSAAQAFGTPVTLTTDCYEMMMMLIQQGLGQDDNCSIVKYYEQCAGTEVKEVQ